MSSCKTCWVACSNMLTYTCICNNISASRAIVEKKSHLRFVGNAEHDHEVSCNQLGWRKYELYWVASVVRYVRIEGQDPCCRQLDIFEDPLLQNPFLQGNPTFREWTLWRLDVISFAPVATSAMPSASVFSQQTTFDLVASHMTHDTFKPYSQRIQITLHRQK